MPIGPIPKDSVALLANVAEDITTEVNEVFLCQQNTGSVMLSQVTVTEAEVGQASFEKLNPQTIQVTVPVIIHCSFKGSSEGLESDGEKREQTFDFAGQVTFETEYSFEVRVAEPPAEVFDSNCSVELLAEAEAGDFDGLDMTQYFSVTLTGSLTCTIYHPQVVVVRKSE